MQRHGDMKTGTGKETRPKRGTFVLYHVLYHFIVALRSSPLREDICTTDGSCTLIHHIHVPVALKMMSLKPNAQSCYLAFVSPLLVLFSCFPSCLPFKQPFLPEGSTALAEFSSAAHRKP